MRRGSLPTPGARACRRIPAAERSVRRQPLVPPSVYNRRQLQEGCLFPDLSINSARRVGRGAALASRIRCRGLAMASDDDGSHEAEDGRKKDGDKREDGNDDERNSGPRSKKPLIIVAAVVVVLAIVGFFVWFARAQRGVDRRCLSPTETSSPWCPRYPGTWFSWISTTTSTSRRAICLVRIDPRDYLTAQSQAQASLALAKAQLQSATGRAAHCPRSISRAADDRPGAAAGGRRGARTGPATVCAAARGGQAGHHPGKHRRIHQPKAQLGRQSQERASAGARSRASCPNRFARLQRPWRSARRR